MSSNLPLTQALYNLQEQQAIQLQQQHDALIREVQQAQVSGTLVSKCGVYFKIFFFKYILKHTHAV